MEQLIVSALVTAVVSSTVGALVGSIVSKARGAAAKSSAEDESMRLGMRALLWRELKDTHQRAVDAGGMPIDERRHLENVYGAYHGIGGNGTGTRLFSDAMSLPVIE